MSLVSTLAIALKGFDRKVWPAHRASLRPEIAATLSGRRLVIADVGAAEGPEERWLGVRKWTRFVNFEPNPRPDAAQDENTVCIPVGLWSSKGRQTLHLTQHPDSSSILPVNETAFADFLVKEGMASAGTTEIELDTLDNCLGTRPDLVPDFLKIDVEGGDLEVLRGAERALSNTVMGVRVEAAWAELRKGGALIWDLDAFLRERGFVLFHLSRVHWLRNNALHGFTSQPQLIWSDVVYFLTRESFLERLSEAAAGERESLLARFVLILLCHGVHDYGIELVDASADAKLVNAVFAENLRRSIKNSADRSFFFFIWSAIGLLFSLGVYLMCWPVPAARTRGRYYLKQRAGRMFHELWRWAARAGRPENACIEDPFV